MKQFIDNTLKPFLIIGGLGTAAAGVYAFLPQFAVEKLANLEYVEQQTFFVQHWGIMVGLMGVMMIAAAFKPSWVLPILIYSTLEKTFMVYLALSNVDQSYAEGFRVPATMDAVIVLYSLVYFWSLRKKT